jgi:hypothetical protein
MPGNDFDFEVAKGRLRLRFSRDLVIALGWIWWAPDILKDSLIQGIFWGAVIFVVWPIAISWLWPVLWKGRNPGTLMESSP